MVHQFERFCKMISIGHYDFGVVPFYRDEHLLPMFYGINLGAVYDNPDIQETQKYLFFPRNNNMVSIGNNLGFSIEAIDLFTKTQK